MQQTAQRQNSGSAIAELEEMLRVITRGIADHPDEIVIMPAPGHGFVHFEVRVDTRDVGTLVGRRGMHADAIRTLMMAAGAVRQHRVTLQIVSHDGDAVPERLASR